LIYPKVNRFKTVGSQLKLLMKLPTI